MNTRPPGGRCCGSGYPHSLGSSVCPEDPREAHDAGKGHADREQNQAVGQAIDRDAIRKQPCAQSVVVPVVRPIGEHQPGTDHDDLERGVPRSGDADQFLVVGSLRIVIRRSDPRAPSAKPTAIPTSSRARPLPDVCGLLTKIATARFHHHDHRVQDPSPVISFVPRSAHRTAPRTARVTIHTPAAYLTSPRDPQLAARTRRSRACWPRKLGRPSSRLGRKNVSPPAPAVKTANERSVNHQQSACLIEGQRLPGRRLLRSTAALARRMRLLARPPAR